MNNGKRKMNSQYKKKIVTVTKKKNEGTYMEKQSQMHDSNCYVWYHVVGEWAHNIDWKHANGVYFLWEKVWIPFYHL